MGQSSGTGVFSPGSAWAGGVGCWEPGRLGGAPPISQQRGDMCRRMDFPDNQDLPLQTAVQMNKRVSGEARNLCKFCPVPPFLCTQERVFHVFVPPAESANMSLYFGAKLTPEIEGWVGMVPSLRRAACSRPLHVHVACSRPLRVCAACSRPLRVRALLSLVCSPGRYPLSARLGSHCFQRARFQQPISSLHLLLPVPPGLGTQSPGLVRVSYPERKKQVLRIFTGVVIGLK